MKEDLLFDTTKTLREGAIRFSQFSNGWQTYLYQANPKINAEKKLADFTADEWDYLKYGERETDGSVSKKQIKVEIRSNNTGRIDKVDYEGVIPRFERLYLKRDITKLKKNLQDEILSFVEKGSCPHCGGTGLNPKALESKIYMPCATPADIKNCPSARRATAADIKISTYTSRAYAASPPAP